MNRCVCTVSVYLVVQDSPTFTTEHQLFIIRQPENSKSNGNANGYYCFLMSVFGFGFLCFVCKRVKSYRDSAWRHLLHKYIIKMHPYSFTQAMQGEARKTHHSFGRFMNHKHNAMPCKKQKKKTECARDMFT